MFGFGKKKANGNSMGSKQANDAVREQLGKHGDDGSSVRHVIHYAYPLGAGGVDDRKVIDKSLREMGFKVKDANSDNGIVFERHQAVTGDDFDLLTEKLSQFFQKLDWTYDGWECAVVTTDNTPD